MLWTDRGCVSDCWFFFSALPFNCNCFQHLQKVHVQFSHEELLEFYNKVRLNSLSFPLECLANKIRHGPSLETVKFFSFFFFSFAARDDSDPVGLTDLMLMVQFNRASVKCIEDISLVTGSTSLVKKERL